MKMSKVFEAEVIITETRQKVIKIPVELTESQIEGGTTPFRQAARIVSNKHYTGEITLSPQDFTDVEIETLSVKEIGGN